MNFFLQKHSSYIFFPEMYIIGLQCWSIALFDGSPACTAQQIFQVRKTVEDPRKSTKKDV